MILYTYIYILRCIYIYIYILRCLCIYIYVIFEVIEANFKVTDSRDSRVQEGSCCWLPPLLRWPLLAAAGSCWISRPAPVQPGSGCNWISSE